MPTISSPATVLVTGANGYIGLWAVLELLARGYTVRGAVRSASKVDVLAALVARKQPDAIHRFTGYVVPDITAPGAFDDAVKGADGVVHTASPVSPPVDDPEVYIRPAVEGTVGILASALKTNVQRVVIVSSIASIASGTVAPPGVYTEEQWNEQAIKTVEEQGKAAPRIIKYNASKTLAERAAWAFLDKHKAEAKFDLCMINPSWVFGPLADDTLPSPSALPATPSHFYNMLFAADRPVALEDREPQCLNYVDVRDVTEMLIRALEVPEAGGERIIANTEAVKWEEWLLANQELKLLPSLETVDPTAAKEHPPHVFFANDKSKRIFGIKLRNVRDTFKDAVEDFRSRGWLKHLEA
ncbi:D-lactaldehyde dehydrogenase [Cubamyces lactineus]|nr:D-lactaldehyde dehydrogenase [Cubamyces lactineus]